MVLVGCVTHCAGDSDVGELPKLWAIGEGDGVANGVESGSKSRNKSNIYLLVAS